MENSAKQGTRGKIAGVVLAGGLARRMGGRTKACIRLGDGMLIEHVIARLAPQVGPLLINANADHATLERLGHPVLGDIIPGHAGPLAGILTGMRWAQKDVPQARWLLSVAVDTPFFPPDLAARLFETANAQNAKVVRACSGERAHPVFALWDIALADDLEKAMTQENIRKIDIFTARHALAEASWPITPFDPFFNINRPEDMNAAERILALLDSC